MKAPQSAKKAKSALIRPAAFGAGFCRLQSNNQMKNRKWA